MKKLEIEKTEKDILERLVKKLSEKTARNYQIVYREYLIELQYEYKGTIIPVHSFITTENGRAQNFMFYYLKGAIEN